MARQKSSSGTRARQRVPGAQRRGSTFVLVVFGMGVMLLFASIAVDVGYLQYTRTRLTTIGTAAAQAGYEALVKHRFDYNANKSKIEDVILEYMRANGASEQETKDAKITISPRGQVHIEMSTDAPLFFSRVIGYFTGEKADSKVNTLVVGDGLLKVNNIAPFAVPTTYHDPDQDGIANWVEADQKIDVTVKPWEFTKQKPYIVKYGRVEGMSRLLKNHVFITMDDQEHFVPLEDGSKYYLPAQDYNINYSSLPSAAKLDKAGRAASNGSDVGILRAYGIAYDVLGLEGFDDAPVNWLLGYCGGSFLISQQALVDSGYLMKDMGIVGGSEVGMLYKAKDKFDTSGTLTGVRFVQLNLAPGPDYRKADANFLEVLEKLRGKEKIKALQITYQPMISTFTEGEDFVTKGMYAAGIPFTAWFLDHVLSTSVTKYNYHSFFVDPANQTRETILSAMLDSGGAYGGEFDWLHVHHEDFANAYVTDTSFLTKTVDEIKAKCVTEVAKRKSDNKNWGCEWEPQTEWYLDNVNDTDGAVPSWIRNYFTLAKYQPGGSSAGWGLTQRTKYSNDHNNRCAKYRDTSCSGFAEIEDLEAAFWAAQEPYTKANLVGAISDFVKKKHKFLFAVCWANEHLEVSLAQLGSKELGKWNAADNAPEIEGGNMAYDETLAFEHFQITKPFLGVAKPWDPDTGMGETSEINDASLATKDNKFNSRLYYLVDYLNPLSQNHLGFQGWDLAEESGESGDPVAKVFGADTSDYFVATTGRTTALRYSVLPALHSSATKLVKEPVLAARGETIPKEMQVGGKVLVQSAGYSSPRSPTGDSPGYKLDSTRNLYYISGIADDDDNLDTGFGRWAYLPGHDPHYGSAHSTSSREWVEACVGKTYAKDRDPYIYEWHNSKHGLGRNLNLDDDDVPGYYVALNKSGDSFHLKDLTAANAKRSYTAQVLPKCFGLNPLVDPDSPVGSPIVLAEPWCCDNTPAVPPDVEWVKDGECYTVAEIVVPPSTTCEMVDVNCVVTTAAYDETIEGDCYDWYTWPAKGGCGPFGAVDGATCPTYYPAGSDKSCPANRAGECTKSTKCDPDTIIHHNAVVSCDKEEQCTTTAGYTIPEREECPMKKVSSGGSPAIVCATETRYVYYGPWTEYVPETDEYRIIALPGPTYDVDQTDVLLSGCVGTQAVSQLKKVPGSPEGYRIYLNNILFGSTVELSAGGNSIPNSGAINPAGLAMGSDEGEYGDTKSVSKNAFSAIMFIGTKGLAMPVGAQFRTAPGDNVETAEAGMDNMTDTDRGGISVTWDEFSKLSEKEKENHRQVVMVPVVERIPEPYEDLKGKTPAEQERILEEFQVDHDGRPLSIYAGDPTKDPVDPVQAHDLHVLGYAKFFLIDKANQLPDTQDEAIKEHFVANEWRKGEIRGYFLGYEHEPIPDSVEPEEPDADPR